MISTTRTVAGAMLALWMMACGSSGDYDSVIKESLGLSEIAPQEVQERIWRDITLRELFTVPQGDEVDFVTPNAVRANESGRFIVMDFEDRKVKGFDHEGQYMSSYGTGIGDGPGEFTQYGLSDMGILQDSLVYVTDRMSQRVSLFSTDGRFLDSYKTSQPLDQYRTGAPMWHSITKQGRRYTLYETGRWLFGVRGNDSSEPTFFGPTMGTDPQSNSIMGLWGMIAHYQEQMVYVPLNYPVLVQYNPDGTVAYARATLDYGHTELPYTYPETVNGFEIERPGGGNVQILLSVSGEHIYVQALLESEPTVDVYEASSGQYEYSFRSVPGTSVFPMNDRLYAIRDSIVIVWAIEWPEP